MRPINLIPLEDRRGESAATRSGPLPYLLVGALVLILAGVAALVLTNNQISDRTADVNELQAEANTATARAEGLAAYAQFHSVRDSRSATVASLADSRFDWERVMRELSLVLPDDVWLTNLTGTASPSVTVDNQASLSGRDTVLGPALQLVGCAPGQEAVARFITVLRDIDGVTRVGVNKSNLPADAAASAGGSGSSSSECQTRDFIAKFEIVVAFDAAPVPGAATDPATGAPVTATVAPAAPTAAPAATTSTGG